jgi:hypothetical protein
LVEPFGSAATYLGHAITSMTVANSQIPKGKKAHDVDEFMPKFEKESQTVDQMVHMAEIFTVGFGGQDLRPTEESLDG